MKRREFLGMAGVTGCGLAFGASAACFGAEKGKSGVTPALGAEDLPTGSAPPPVPCPHFPSRLHAFVWRNWQLVPAERMAAVVGATPAQIMAVGEAMGLGSQPRITRDRMKRFALTVIRRNWHLLPYPQLLELLGWSADELAFALREDDFLFIKLGSLKPRCDRITWEEPAEATRAMERQIAETVRRELGRLDAVHGEDLFGFVAKLSAGGPEAKPSSSGRDLRFCYSYFALYGDPVLDREADPYPEGYLARLAAAGVTGVWLQGVLYKLAAFPWQPALSGGSKERLQNLRRLVARANRHGIKVFLYLNEPRAMPLRFFEDHPALKGVVEGDHAVLCTSVPEVQEYMVRAVSTICEEVPELGGFFTITASENLTNCWSHHHGEGCPRCGRRAPAEVIAEVNGLVARGIRRSGSKARLIAWDWGWNDSWAQEIIRLLPPEASLMSVSEWSLPIERGGVKGDVGEYSISSIGPGPRAKRHWEMARKRGLRAIAKIQAGNTWELSAVPYIPALENVAVHAANLRQAGVDGLMLGWTLGGYPSPNIEVVAECMAGKLPQDAMRTVAERRVGKRLASLLVEAWTAFSKAFSEFPFDTAVLYNGPQQLGPANLLWAQPTGYRSTMTGFPYDDLDGWRGRYPAEVFANQFDKVADGFNNAIARLREKAASVDATRAQMQALEDELRVAEAAAIHFKSAANQARFVASRRALAQATDPAEARRLIDAIEHLVRNEQALARRLYALQRQDSRIGFEAANQYFYVPLDLAEKVLNCRDLLERWLPEERRRRGV
ncbi:MAG: hypothetical protein QHJ82_13615 [Verrucomicrobiota bacterium]|nr:hypothetical protein [Verrucomicrobiota bacterium]